MGGESLRIMIRVVLSEPFAGLRSFAEQLPEQFAASGETLFRGRNEIRRFEVEGVPVVVKKFRNNRLKQLLSLVRRGKAEKSYRHGCRLEQLGVPTPTPMGYVELRSRLGLVREAYYLSAYIPYPSLVEVNPSEEHFNRALMTDFARFVAGLHGLGVLHDDLNTGNVRCEERAEGMRFWLIDINRMRFAKEGKPLSRKACFGNVVRFSYNTPMFHHFLHAYLEARGWSERLFEEALVRKVRHDRFTEWKRSLKGRR